MSDKTQSEPPKFEFDSLAEKLVPDPSRYPDGVPLTGFLGRSAQEGNVRLYDDVSFRRYYEISVSDILHTQQLQTTQAPLGGSVVYVKCSARLRRVQVSTEIEAQFLQGPMSATAKSGAGLVWTLGANRPLLINRPTGDLCPSDAPTSCSDRCGGGGGGQVHTDFCWSYVQC